jgi:hypothetical protein
VKIRSEGTDVLRRHSTFFGFAFALITAAAVGQLTHWSALWITVTAIVGIVVLPRCLYGFREARELDRERVSPGSGITGRGWSPQPSEGERIADAYRQAKALGTNWPPDNDDFKQR